MDQTHIDHKFEEICGSAVVFDLYSNRNSETGEEIGMFLLP